MTVSLKDLGPVPKALGSVCKQRLVLTKIHLNVLGLFIELLLLF